MFGFSLKPEVILGMVKAIPQEKINAARQELISSITQAEINAGSELMIVISTDIKQSALVFALYKKTGEYLTHALVYDIQSALTAIEQIKNFDFKKNNQNAIPAPQYTADSGENSNTSNGIPDTSNGGVSAAE